MKHPLMSWRRHRFGPAACAVLAAALGVTIGWAAPAAGEDTGTATAEPKLRLAPVGSALPDQYLVILKDDTAARVGPARAAGDLAARHGNFVDFDDTDCHGHGTHVGIIGGKTFGVAKAVQLVGLKAFDCAGDGSIISVIEAVNWVTREAIRPAVVDMSLGYRWDEQFVSTLDDAVRASIDSGIAGDTASKVYSGTSQAAPHVAGVAALHLQRHPTATPAQVRAAVVGNGVQNAVTGNPTVRRTSGCTPRSRCTARPVTTTAPALRPRRVAAVDPAVADRRARHRDARPGR